MAGEQDEDNLADNIFEVEAYEVAKPPHKEFLAWHRPRKQFVRQHQWCEQIARLLADHPREDRVLKYLGLPGVDLLDLRHFHAEICESKQINLRFLGFNSGARPQSAEATELNISLDEVRRLPMVDQQSDVIPDDFALIAREGSIAAQRTRDHGPFDVVNLDLCDGFGGHAPGGLQSNYYNAVTKLLGLQARIKTPWLLFLTTKADSPNIDSAVLGRLVEKYISNLTSCENFRTASANTFQLNNENGVRSAAADEVRLQPVFLVGLCKWFLGLGLEQSPPTTVELKSIQGYRVVAKSQREDLISLALKFTPMMHAVADPLGLANNSEPAPDECALATRIVGRVAKMVDVDATITGDATLKGRLIAATTSLLQQARYDISGYEKWLTI